MAQSSVTSAICDAQNTGFGHNLRLYLDCGVDLRLLVVVVVVVVVVVLQVVCRPVACGGKRAYSRE